MKYDEDDLNGMSNSELHRLLSADRAVFAVFNEIMMKTRARIRQVQTVLSGRGAAHGSEAIPYNSLARPIVGGGITQHAILRYLERVKGMDIRAIEDEILARVNGGEGFYNGAVVIDSEGFGYIMREDGLVKSVMPSEWIDDAAGVSAERDVKLKRRRDKADHFRGLAAAGLDTDPRKRQAVD